MPTFPTLTKLAAFTDDILLFLKEPHISISNLLKDFKLFHYISNFKINFASSHALNITLSPLVLYFSSPSVNLMMHRAVISCSAMMHHLIAPSSTGGISIPPLGGLGNLPSFKMAVTSSEGMFTFSGGMAFHYARSHDSGIGRQVSTELRCVVLPWRLPPSSYHAYAQ